MNHRVDCIRDCRQSIATFGISYGAGQGSSQVIGEREDFDENTSNTKSSGRKIPCIEMNHLPSQDSYLEIDLIFKTRRLSLATV